MILSHINSHNELINYARKSANLELSYDHIFKAQNKLIRCGTIDKPKSKDAWLQVFINPDGSQIANFGNFKIGITRSIKLSQSTKTFSLNKKQLHYQETARKNEKSKLEKAKLLKILTTHYNSLPIMESTHSYLEEKGIPDILMFAQTLGLKVSKCNDQAKIYNNDTLLIPFYNGITLQGYQQIYFDGKKFQKRYTGSISGYSLTYRTSTIPRFILLSEGFATGWTAYLALNNSADSTPWGAIVVIRFDSGNLKKIAGSLYQYQLPILLLVDYDAKTFIGENTAKELIYNNPELQIIPILLHDSCNLELPIDANDYIIRFGENLFYSYVQQQLTQYGLEGLFA